MTDDLRPIPHALGTEKAVLSVIFQEPEMLDDCPSLTPDHFHLPAHRIIFEAIKATSAAGRKVELVSFIQSLIETDLLQRVGGPSAIADIHSYQPSSLHFKRHLEILTEYAARRTAIAGGRGLVEMAFEDGDIGAVVAAAGKTADAIAATLTSSTEPPTLREILNDSVARFESRVRGTSDSMGIPTLPLLDQHLKGGHPGRLWVIGAYPEGGKSVLASQMILDAAHAGHPVAFLSLEMSERDVCDRMVVQAARIDCGAFTEPKQYARDNGMDGISKGILTQVQSSVKSLLDLPLMIIKPSNRRLATVLGAIRRAHREVGAKLIAVDYVQLIKAEADNREGEISEVSHSLQAIAGELGITILALTQLNQDGDTKHGRVIEEDADAVIQIVQDRNKESSTYKLHRYILIAKDRHYGSGGKRVPLILDRKRIRFVEGTDESEAAKEKKPNFKR